LTRIESEAFSYSSLQSIVIPRNVRFIDGSAFIGVTLSSISIESGNDIFVVENGFLVRNHPNWQIVSGRFGILPEK
jgi:hypothetical protein